MPEVIERSVGQEEAARRLKRLGKKIGGIPRPITEVLAVSDGKTVFDTDIPQAVISRRIDSAERYNNEQSKKPKVAVTALPFPETNPEVCLHCDTQLAFDSFHMQRTGDAKGFRVVINRRNGQPELKSDGPQVTMDLPYLAVHLLQTHGLSEGDGQISGHITVDLKSVDEFFDAPVIEDKEVKPLIKPDKISSFTLSLKVQ